MIYGLVDPMTNELRYIGKSSRGLKRPLEHAKHARKSSNPRSHLYRWIKKLQAFGHDPEIISIEDGHPDEDDLNEAERFFISYFRSIGSRLTNATLGGDGIDSDTRRQLWKDPDIRQRQIEAIRKAVLDPAWISKMSQAFSGEKNNSKRADVRAKMSQSAKRRYADPVQKLRNAEQLKRAREMKSARTSEHSLSEIPSASAESSVNVNCVISSAPPGK